MAVNPSTTIWLNAADIRDVNDVLRAGLDQLGFPCDLWHITATESEKLDHHIEPRQVQLSATHCEWLHTGIATALTSDGFTEDDKARFHHLQDRLAA